MRIENGKYSAGEHQELWTLNEKSFSRKRTFSDKIKFSQPFENPPKIIIAISGFDIYDRKETGPDSSTSLDAQAARITTDGFSVLFTAYEASRIKGLTIEWLAIGM